MSRTIRVIVATAVAGVSLDLIGKIVGFSSWAFLVGLVVAMVLVSLVDRDGFYGTSSR